MDGHSIQLNVLCNHPRLQYCVPRTFLYSKDRKLLLRWVCQDLVCDSNIADVSKGIGMDKRIGHQFLSAGLGWGGSCFPKDVQGLVKVSEGLGYDFAFLKEVEKINI